MEKKYQGSIFVEGPMNLEFRVCDVFYAISDSGEFIYKFVPNYSVISLLDAKYFQGIPGLKLELKKKEYIRENIVPVFISERVPSKNRMNYQEELAKVKMRHMNPIEYLIRTDEKYSGDNLYMKKYEEYSTIDLAKISGKNNTTNLMGIVLKQIALGNKIIFNDSVIDEKNYKDIYDVLKYFYSKSMKNNYSAQLRGINVAKRNNVYKGRKPVPFNFGQFLELEEKVKRNETTTIEAAKKLNISIDKYYRERRKLYKQGIMAAAKDKNFISRTLKCEKDFEYADASLLLAESDDEYDI